MPRLPAHLLQCPSPRPPQPPATGHSPPPPPPPDSRTQDTGSSSSELKCAVERSPRGTTKGGAAYGLCMESLMVRPGTSAPRPAPEQSGTGAPGRVDGLSSHLAGAFRRGEGVSKTLAWELRELSVTGRESSHSKLWLPVLGGSRAWGPCKALGTLPTLGSPSHTL